MVNNDYTRLSVIAGNIRLDKFLAGIMPRHSRAVLQALIAGGGVQVDGCACLRTAHKVSGGSEVGVNNEMLAALAPSGEDCAPEALQLDIIYEDEALLVVNKPPGLVTHPGHGNRRGTLQAGLLHHHADAAALVRGGIVHRLDKDTSGLLAVAKTAAAQKHLINQFKQRDIRREYLALVHGMPPATGVINQPIRRHRYDPLRMNAGADGKEALTHYARQKQWRGFALLRCSLVTGRTHQIRVHLEYNGFPVVGDKVYHRRAVALPFAVERQMLHAAHLRLLHPQTASICEWTSPLPADMQAVSDQLDAAAGG